MYESPIKIIQGQMETKIENDIFQAIQHYGVDVDKDALVSALMYDRKQYEKGYAEGREDGKKEILNKVIQILSECSFKHEVKDSEYFMGKTIKKYVNIECFKELFEDSCTECPFYNCPDTYNNCDECEKKTRKNSTTK